MPAEGQFDYIIVGAGSAGCVLANRLSADGCKKVLLLEAGGSDRSSLIQIPFGAARIWNAPAYNWSYFSEPEQHADNRKLFHPRGKVLGGSGSINMTAYVRGNRADFDGWAQRGLLGWSSERVLPYFKRMENFTGPGDEFRGNSGPLRVSPAAPDSEADHLVNAFFEAGRANGIQTTDDYNGKDQDGLCYMQFNSSDGRRYSSSVAYLRPALSRPNVRLEARAHTTRILFKDNRAIGLEYRQGGVLHQLMTDGEIILSGGTYNSAQLLMLSGVGPAPHLREMGISVVADRTGVGENLQDHPSFPTEYLRRARSSFLKNLRLDKLTWNMARAKFFRNGPAANPLGRAGGFVRSRPELDAPDLQIFLRLWPVQAQPWIPAIKPPVADGLGFMIVHIQPESRGTVRLRSKDPFDAPVITNNLLSTDEDRAALRRGFRLTRDLISHPAMAAHVTDTKIPSTELETDDEIDGFIREFLNTFYHPVGTCRMGADRDAVTDEDLRVRDVENLRVVDASVMPTITRGNTNAPTMMIAEKASDAILGHDSLAATQV